MLNFDATGKMFCDNFEAKKKKKVSYIYNISDNNIVFVSQFQGLDYFGYSLLAYSISSCWGGGLSETNSYIQITLNDCLL